MERAEEWAGKLQWMSKVDGGCGKGYRLMPDHAA